MVGRHEKIKLNIRIKEDCIEGKVMQIFNYASYIRAFENGVSNPNMTYIARALFEPIFNAENVYNRSGYPYVMTSTMAKAWYDQTADIPKNIKKAAGRQDIIDSIGDYFAADILGEVTNQNKESQMYLAMSALVEDSNLAPDQKGLLMQLYQDGDRPEFLGRAFLFAIVANNREKVSVVMEEPIDTDIRRFKEMIKKIIQSQRRCNRRRRLRIMKWDTYTNFTGYIIKYLVRTM